MADNSEDIATLQAELAALRVEVAALHRELYGARAHIDLTMRGQLRCRACNCRRIAHVPKVLDRDGGGVEDLSLVGQTNWWALSARGKLEVYVCTRCGLVEWWVTDPAALEPHDEHVVILDGGVSGPKDPYR